MSSIRDALLGQWSDWPYVAVKTVALFLTAAVTIRLGQRRALGQFAPFDWAVAVAVGAIVGRTATAPDTSWVIGAVAIVVLMVAHTLVNRMRFIPALRGLIDPPVRILIRDGTVSWPDLRRCGLTEADLDEALRQHGIADRASVHLALFEAKGGISVLRRKPRTAE